MTGSYPGNEGPFSKVLVGILNSLLSEEYFSEHKNLWKIFLHVLKTRKKKNRLGQLCSSKSQVQLHLILYSPLFLMTCCQLSGSSFEWNPAGFDVEKIFNELFNLVFIREDFPIKSFCIIQVQDQVNKVGGVEQTHQTPKSFFCVILAVCGLISSWRRTTFFPLSSAVGFSAKVLWIQWCSFCTYKCAF